MLEISVIVVCLLFNAVLACAEIAFVAVRKSALLEEGSERAKLLIKLKEHPEKVLSVIQVGITFVAMLAAGFGGSGAEEQIAPWLAGNWGMSELWATILSVLIVIIPLTYFSVVIGELVPKILALRSPAFFSLLLVRLLQVLSIILLPIIKVLEASTKLIVNLFVKLIRPHTPAVEGEIVELSELGPRSRQYVMNIVGIQKKKLKEIMLSWDKVTSIRKVQSVEEVEETALSSGHTRIPILEGEEVVGILHTKEFFAWKKSGRGEDWFSIVRPPKKFDGDSSLFNTLVEMQKEKIHQAIVQENGKKIGIVTMEDILEEIVGEIYDEDDAGTLTRLMRRY